MIKLVFPWFNPVLNPNVKKFYMVKAKAQKSQKNEWYFLTKKQLPIVPEMATVKKNLTVQKTAEGIELSITYYPPDKKRRDKDNCKAAIKGGLDGLALAIGIDDRYFSYGYERNGEVREGGEIEIEIKF